MPVVHPNKEKLNMSKGIKLVAVAIFALALAACGQMTWSSSGGSAASSFAPSQGGVGYVGVFIPKQDPHLDNVVRNLSEDEYFIPVWREYEAGRIRGASAQVRVFFTDGTREVDIFRGHVSGHKYFPVSRSAVSSGTTLCVEVPWRIIAQQRVSGGDGIMCEAGVYNWFAQGRGRTPEDAWGVIAIAPAGS